MLVTIKSYAPSKVRLADFGVRVKLGLGQDKNRGVKSLVTNNNASENCEKLDAVENMTDEGSCIRLRSLICALKGAQRDDIEQMKEVITGIIPQVSLYFVQAYELWLAAEARNEVTLDLEPNDDLSLGSFSFLPIDAPHDQINEEIYR